MPSHMMYGGFPGYRLASHNSGLDFSSSHSSTISVSKASKTPVSPPPSPRNPNRRRVSFDEKAQVYSTIHNSEYSEEERTNTWLTPSDLEAIKSERQLCLRKMEMYSSPVDDDQHYFRGLEARTKEGYKRKRFNIADATMTVMEEQSDPADLGSSHPSVISKAYIAATRHCVEEARQRGQFDERAALFKSGVDSLINYI